MPTADDSSEIQFIATSKQIKERNVETIDLTSLQGTVWPVRDLPVKVELKDPLEDILAETSEDEEHIEDENMMDSLDHDVDMHYTDNEMMVQEILDLIIDNLDKETKKYKLKEKEKLYQSARVLFYSEATEYVEEKPVLDSGDEDDDTGNKSLSIYDVNLDTGGKCKKDTRVNIENLTLNYDDWSEINKVLKDREDLYGIRFDKRAKMMMSEDTRMWKATSRECTLCDATCPTKNALRTHMYRKHPESIKKSFEGDEMKTLNKNKRISLKKVKFYDGSRRVERDCSDCEKSFRDSHDLKRHMLARHDKVVYSAIPNQIRLLNRTVEITPMQSSIKYPASRQTNGGSKSSGKQKRSTATKSTTKPPRRCGNCKTCMRDDCRQCVMCLDMKKYGGKGVKKQRCQTRPTCLEFLKGMGKKELSRDVARGLVAKQSRTSSPVATRVSSPMSSSPRTLSPATSRARMSSPGPENPGEGPAGRPRKRLSDDSASRLTRSPTSGIPRKRLSEDSSSRLSRSPNSISAARKHLRDVESDNEPPRTPPSTRPRGSGSPFRLRDKDSDIDLKERLRRRAEGEWNKVKPSNTLTNKFKQEREKKNVVSNRKVPPPVKNWPSKEELLFGFIR